MILNEDDVVEEIVDGWFEYGDENRALVIELVQAAFREGVRAGYNAVYDSAVREEIEAFFADEFEYARR